MYKVLLGLSLLFSLGIFSVTVVPYFVERNVQGAIHYMDDPALEKFDTVLILGERVYLGETLSPILRARTDAAIYLYNQGVVGTVIASGEKVGKHYSEAAAVKKILLVNGVLEEDIILDENGFNDYESLRNAKELGGTSLLIPATLTELPRLLYIAKDLEMESVGVIAETEEGIPTLQGSRENLLTLWTVFQLIFK